MTSRKVHLNQWKLTCQTVWRSAHLRRTQSHECQSTKVCEANLIASQPSTFTFYIETIFWKGRSKIIDAINSVARVGNYSICPWRVPIIAALAPSHGARAHTKYKLILQLKVTHTCSLNHARASTFSELAQIGRAKSTSIESETIIEYGWPSPRAFYSYRLIDWLIQWMLKAAVIRSKINIPAIRALNGSIHAYWQRTYCTAHFPSIVCINCI